METEAFFASFHPYFGLYIVGGSGDGRRIMRDISVENYVVSIKDEIYIGNGINSIAVINKSFDYNTDTYSEEVCYYMFKDGSFVQTEGKYKSKEELEKSGEYQVNRLSSDCGFYLYRYDFN